MRGAGGMAHEEDAPGIAAIGSAIRLDPRHHLADILGRRRPGMLRREAIVDVEAEHALPREEGGDVVIDRSVAALVAADEAAAMDEDDDRHLLLVLGRIDVELL